MKMKKILFVLSQLGTGGAERVISILTNYFAHAGYTTYLITYIAGEDAYQIDSDVIRYRIPPIEGNRIKQHLQRMKIIRKYISEKAIDTYVTFEHYYGFTCVLGSKVCYTTSMRNDPKHDTLSLVERILRYFNFRFAHNIVFQTEEIKNYFSTPIVKHGVVIQNPLPNSIVNYAGNRDTRVVAVSRLEPQKNLKMLIDAFVKAHEKHQEYTLEIYGDGSEREVMTKYIEQNDLSQCVTLMGFAKNVGERICNASIYACSSNYEGLSNALLEAMAMGLSVVTTDSAGGGARSVVDDWVNGVLIPVGNTEKMAEAFDLLMQDQFIRERMGNNAKTIRKKLSETAICNQWKSTIE